MNFIDIKTPPLIKEADEVTERHIEWMHNRFYVMRKTDPVRWRILSQKDTGERFCQVFRKNAKNKALDVLVERGVLRRWQERIRRMRRIEMVTYYKLINEELDAQDYLPDNVKVEG